MTNIKLDGYFLEGVCDHCTRIKPVIAECNVFLSNDVKDIRVSCEHYHICKNAAKCIKKTNELN